MDKLDLKEEIIKWKEHMPLAVGTAVWFLDMFTLDNPIIETTIAQIVVDDKGVRFRLGKNSTYLTALSALGKTVFLTREQAESRLLQMGV